MVERGKGLEFLVGGHGIVVPAALVDRVVEVQLSPAPPMARPWLGGFGEVQGLVFATVDLVPGTFREGELSTCVLLSTEKTKLKWGLRVMRTVGFVDIVPCARSSSLPSDWPSWVSGARFAGEKDDRSVGLLDVTGMTQDFEK